MTRIGPTAAARTCCKRAANTDAIHRTRRAMCAACNGNRPRCPQTDKPVTLHIKGEPCPRGWHPDKRGRVKWAGALWSGVPFPLRLYLWLRLDDRDLDEFVASFPGCGCIRPLKAAWMWLVRKWRKAKRKKR